MSGREAAERHGQYVINRNWQALGADIGPGALEEFQKSGKSPPRGTTKAEIVNESQEDHEYDHEG